jgi:hypothetical protein
MAHEVAPRFLDRRINLPPTVKMPNLGFLVSEHFFPNGKKIRFPSISDGGKMRDVVNLITGSGREKRSRHLE